MSFGHGGITKNLYRRSRIINEAFRGRPDERICKPRSSLDIEDTVVPIETLSTFDLLINNQVNFIGWDCCAGVSMVVTFSGEIYRAWCVKMVRSALYMIMKLRHYDSLSN